MHEVWYFYLLPLVTTGLGCGETWTTATTGGTVFLTIPSLEASVTSPTNPPLTVLSSPDRPSVWPSAVRPLASFVRIHRVRTGQSPVKSLYRLLVSNHSGVLYCVHRLISDSDSCFTTFSTTADSIGYDSVTSLTSSVCASSCLKSDACAGVFVSSGSKCTMLSYSQGLKHTLASTDLESTHFYHRSRHILTYKHYHCIVQMIKTCVCKC